MSSTQKHYLKINPYLDIISGITVVLSFSDGIIKIIGREGSGKSVLTQLLAAELVEEEQEVVIFSDIPHSETDLHNPIQQQLHLNLGENSDFYAALNRHIQARPYDQQKLILVFDDADQIPDDCFNAIRMLFEKNYHDRPEVSMVFAGSELLDQKLSEPQNRTFNKNIILNFEVKPMNRGELEAFCNAYLEEMGLKSHHLTNADFDGIYAQTQGLPGKIPELIFAILDREEEEKQSHQLDHTEDKSIISKLVELDDDPEPTLAGLSVEDREEVLTAFKDQVPWRWQSNGVGIAVVVLFVVVAYGYLVPVEDRSDSIVIFPPPAQFPGQLSPEEVAALAAETPVEESLADTQAEIATDIGEDPQLAIEETTVEVPVAEPAPEETVEEELEAIVTPEPEVAAAPETNNPEAQEPEIETETETEPAPDTSTPELIAETEVAEPAPAETAATTEPLIDEEAQTTATPQTGLLTVVTNWLAAWEGQNLDSYFQAYHSEFTPDLLDSFEAWQADRTTKINRPSSINIDMEDFEIINEGNNETSVRVQFTYESPTYADRSVKELVFRVENGDWAISEEHTIEVEQLALSSSATSVPASSEPIALLPGESGFAAKIRQVLSLSELSDSNQLNTPFGMLINDWLEAWKSQDVEGYFRHYHDNFEPAYFSTMSDWRADRIRCFVIYKTFPACRNK